MSSMRLKLKILGSKDQDEKSTDKEQRIKVQEQRSKDKDQI